MRYREPEGIIRSNSHDTKWFFALCASVRTLELIGEKLSSRVDITGEREAISSVHDEALRITEKLLNTFPPEKHPAIERQMESIYYRIDVARPVNANKANTLMDVDDLGVLIKYAHKMNCQICSHPTWCGNRCDLGKVFDRCCPESRGYKESWAFIDIGAADD